MFLRQARAEGGLRPGGAGLCLLPGPLVSAAQGTRRRVLPMERGIRLAGSECMGPPLWVPRGKGGDGT
jgi:hypothetical protein